MKTKFVGLFVLCITLGYTTFANAGCIHRNEAQYQQCMNKTPPVDLDHPGQRASNFPPQLREFKQVMSLPEDLAEIYSTRGACSEANGWTGVRNANGSYGCGEYTSSSQGSKWKAVFHESKAYKLFKLEPYVAENGEKKFHWILQVDRDATRGLYAVNGNAPQNPLARDEPSGNTPSIGGMIKDVIKKGEGGVKLPGGISIPKW